VTFEIYGFPTSPCSPPRHRATANVSVSDIFEIWLSMRRTRSAPCGKTGDGGGGRIEGGIG
jgi:hypothetical protein